MYYILYYDDGKLKGSIECYSMDDVRIALDEWMKCETRVDSIRVNIVKD